MPYGQYISVTLKRDVIRELNAADPDDEKSVSAKVTEAILEYIQVKTAKPISQTFTPGLLSSKPSSTAAPVHVIR